jgi:hypothetical protein
MSNIHSLPATPSNARALAMGGGGSIITGEQIVGHYEANVIAAAQQKRLAVAEAARPRLKALDASLNQIDAEIAHVAPALASARADMARDGLHPAKPQFTPGVYWGLMAVVLVAEAGVAHMGIQPLGLEDPVPMMLAATLGGITFLAAKSVAKVSRQWRHADRVEIGMAAITTGIFLALSIMLGQLRASTNPDPVAGWASLFIILFCFAAMVLLSALQIDPDRRAEELASRINRLEQQLHGKNGLWSRRRKIAEGYNALRDKTILKIEDWVHDAAERIAQYRNANARRRTTQQPSWFAEPISTALFPYIDMGPAIDPSPTQIARVAQHASTAGKDDADGKD